MKIVIAGGGPGGLITALYLRRLPGAEIVIHEKQAEPDYAASLCAEGLSADKMGKLEADTGFSSRPFMARQVQGLKVTFPNRKSGLIYQAGCTLDRTAWQRGMVDHLRKQGVTIHFESPLTDADQADADLVIGADGPASKIRKAIGGSVQMKPAVQYRMRLDYPHDFLEFFFDAMFYAGHVGYGYGWIFPKGELCNVGVAGTFEMLDAFIEKYDIRGEIVEKGGAPIPINGTCFEKGRVLLAGDAAGLTNPLSGGGLAAIICCADYLCQAIADGRPGRYTELIRANGFWPPDWRDKKDIFYQPDAVLRLAGDVCNNERISRKNLRFLGRACLCPGLWGPLVKMAPHIWKFKRVSW